MNKANLLCRQAPPQNELLIERSKRLSVGSCMTDITGDKNGSEDVFLQSPEELSNDYNDNGSWKGYIHELESAKAKERLDLSNGLKVPNRSLMLDVNFDPEKRRSQLTRNQSIRTSGTPSHLFEKIFASSTSLLAEELQVEEEDSTLGKAEHYSDDNGQNFLQDKFLNFFGGGRNLNNSETLPETLFEETEDNQSSCCAKQPVRMMNESVELVTLPERKDEDEEPNDENNQSETTENNSQNVDARDDAYVRSLEEELVQLKLELAQAQAQIEEVIHYKVEMARALAETDEYKLAVTKLTEERDDLKLKNQNLKEQNQDLCEKNEAIRSKLDDIQLDDDYIVSQYQKFYTEDFTEGEIRKPMSHIETKQVKSKKKEMSKDFPNIHESLSRSKRSQSSARSYLQSETSFSSINDSSKPHRRGKDETSLLTHKLQLLDVDNSGFVFAENKNVHRPEQFLRRSTNGDGSMKKIPSSKSTQLNTPKDLGNLLAVNNFPVPEKQLFEGVKIDDESFKKNQANANYYKMYNLLCHDM